MTRVFNAACSVTWAILPASLELLLEIAAREHVPDWEAVETKRARRHDQAESIRMRDGIAVLNVTGPIVRYADLFAEVSGATSVGRLAKDFATAVADPNVTGILLNVDSPGGEVAGINEFAQMVYAARGSKPIVAYVDGMAASAAYWIASAADEIVTDATGLLGSIGVAATVPDPEKRSARDVQFISSQSPRKRPNPKTESGREQLQEMVDDLASVFVAAVARNRGTSEDEVLEKFGRGAVMVGEKAVAAGLADRLGSFEALLAEMAAGKRRPARRTAAEAAEREDMKETFEKIRARVLAAFAEEEPAITVSASDLLAEPVAVATEPVAAVDLAGLEALEQAEAEKAELRQQLAAARAAETAARIDAFLDEQFTAGRFLPAERAQLRGLLLQAATDDVALPLPEGARIEQVQAAITARPANRLTEELVVGGEGRILRADENGQTELSEERRAALLEKTPLGRAAFSLVK